MMILRSAAWKKAGLIAQGSTTKPACFSKVAALASMKTTLRQVSTRRSSEKRKPLDLSSLYESPSNQDAQQRSDDKDLVISVFESSPTKRDAKLYLQKFGPGAARQQLQKRAQGAAVGPAGENGARIADPAQGEDPSGAAALAQNPNPTVTTTAPRVPHVALVKVREPQSIDDTTLKGLGKTLVNLRELGMTSIVVIDCDIDAVKREEWWSTLVQQTERVIWAGQLNAKVVDSALGIDTAHGKSASRFSAGGIFVAREEPLIGPLRQGSIVIVPACATSTDTFTAQPVDTNELILALTRYLSGMQFPTSAATSPSGGSNSTGPGPKASVDRLILIDPLGGTPAKYRPNGAHMFLNMAEEYETAMRDIKEVSYPQYRQDGTRLRTQSSAFVRKKHTDNLELTKLILAMLPSTSSVVITTPEEAANVAPAPPKQTGLLGTTEPRKTKNALIFNMLTDRPVHSSSLPLGRIRPSKGGAGAEFVNLSRTTLAKKGMPLTIIPDPRVAPWVPPRPGAPRLRLTDTCVDLPRLVHLIEDSFGRKLDVQHYLDRVSETMAGIIIAGEYEGGAILTWERPSGVSEEEAYREGRLVPYLDKFAVLQKSQGAGGVADIVFNAMVRGCFPEGVCWRSRKDNPVNKWYFERSRGFKRLSDSNWTMFWTTEWEEETLRDYEDVCRNVLPSWADKKHIVD